MGKRSTAVIVAVGFFMVAAWWAPALAATECGVPALAPRHQPGEKWTWRDERGGQWSEAVLEEGDLTQMKWPTGDVAFHEKDMVVRLVSRPNGQLISKQGTGLYTIVGQKTLEFPLQVGMGWAYHSFSQATKGGRGNLAPIWYVYRVLACEEVSTPAGTFPAFKVEVAEVIGDRALGAFPPQGHGIYHLWYAPQAKNYVKRHYEPSAHWVGPAFRDYDLIKFEVK